MKLLIRLVAIIFFSTFINSCVGLRNKFKSLDRPSYSYSDSKVLPDNSHIAIDFNIDYKTLETELNTLLKDGYSNDGDGEIDRQFQFKEKNPLYDPKEWIKTKNPKYNPNEWVEVKTKVKIGPFSFSHKWVKTKNPLYDPNKWIKTKNPLYNPNKWIYGNTIKVNIGYNYKYSFTRRKNIKFIGLDNNILRLIIPLEIDGNIGFEGDGAKLFSLTKKTFKSSIDFIVDTQIDINENWCPVIRTNLNHKWVDSPKIEIIDNVWIPLTIPSELALFIAQERVEQIIYKSIDCENIQEKLIGLLQPRSIPLDDLDKNFGLSKGMFLNLSLTDIGMSNLIVSDQKMKISLATNMVTKIGEKENNKAIKELPKLSKVKAPENIINLSVPISFKYKEMESKLRQNLVDTLKYIFDAKIKLGNNFVELKDVSVQITDCQLYPSDSLLTIGVKVDTKFPNKILSTKGWVFLTSEPQIINGELQLNNIKFTTDLNNPLYPIINSIFSKKIVSVIKEQSKRDLNPFYDKLILLGEQKLDELLTENNILEVKRYNPKVKISDILIQKEELIIVTNLVSGIEANVITTPIKDFNLAEMAKPKNKNK